MTYRVTITASVLPSERPSCPKCHKNNTLEIIYGLIYVNDEITAQIREQKVTLGGDVVSLTTPMWKCPDCENRWDYHYDYYPRWYKPFNDLCISEELKLLERAKKNWKRHCEKNNITYQEPGILCCDLNSEGILILRDYHRKVLAQYKCKIGKSGYHLHLL